MKDDYEFDDMISRAARDLDAPTPPPREAMWSAIQAAREEERAAENDIVVFAPPLSAADGPAASDPGIAPARSHAWLRYGAPLAAMLVIGVGVGRMTLHDRNREDRKPAIASALPETVARGTVAPSNAGDSSDASVRDDAAARNLAALNRPPITSVAPGDGGPSLARSAARPSRAPAGDAVVRGSASAASSSERSNGRTYDTSLPYRMVATRHFSRIQLLLIAMPEDVRDGHINEVAVRAADLLVNTRLLLDSPVAKEHEMRRLLEDLELILAQAATISPTHSADDVNMIQKAINQRDVLLRLHAVTAGPRLSGT